MWRLQVSLGVIAVALVFGAGYAFGINSEAERFSEYRVKVETAMEVLGQKNEEQRRRYDQISKDAAAGYEAALVAHSRGSGRIRVQQCPSHRPGVPAPATTPASTGEAAAESAHSAGRSEAVSVERCEEIANRAVMDAAQVLHLQQWYSGLRETSRSP